MKDCDSTPSIPCSPYPLTGNFANTTCYVLKLSTKWHVNFYKHTLLKIPKMRPAYQLFAIILIPILPLVAGAENWPGWRGPRGDGSSLSQSLPLEWDAPSGKNIIWKTPLPGAGHASPVIWEDHVFIATCDMQSQSRQLIALDRHSGKILWNREVLKARLEKKHSLMFHGQPKNQCSSLIYICNYFFRTY